MNKVYPFTFSNTLKNIVLVLPYILIELIIQISKKKLVNISPFQCFPGDFCLLLIQHQGRVDFFNLFSAEALPS